MSKASKEEQQVLNFNLELTSGAVKTAMKEAAAKARDLWQVPIGQIKVIPGFNLRFEGPELAAHVRSIADSIKEHGFYLDKPLAGYIAVIDGVQVICLTEGHCRYNAALIAIAENAPLETLPMVVKDRSATMEDLTVALFKSNEGKHFTPYELAIGAKRFVGFGREDAYIAKVLNVTPSYVGELLILAGAAKAITDMVRSDQISASMAVQAIRAFGDKAAEKLLSAVKGAIESGKTKATPKHLPGVERVKYIKKQSNGMFSVIEKIHQHEAAFAALPDELKKLIEDLLKGAPVDAEKDDVTQDATGAAG